MSSSSSSARLDEHLKIWDERMENVTTAVSAYTVPAFHSLAPRIAERLGGMEADVNQLQQRQLAEFTECKLQQAVAANASKIVEEAQVRYGSIERALAESCNDSDRLLRSVEALEQGDDTADEKIELDDVERSGN